MTRRLLPLLLLAFLAAHAFSSDGKPAALVYGSDVVSNCLSLLNAGGWSVQRAEGDRGKLGTDGIDGRSAVFVFGRPAPDARRLLDFVDGGGLLVLSADREGNFAVEEIAAASDGRIATLVLSERKSGSILVKYDNWNELNLFVHPNRIVAFPEASARCFTLKKTDGKNRGAWRIEGILQGRTHREPGEVFAVSQRVGRGMIVATSFPVSNGKFYANLAQRLAALNPCVDVRSASFDFAGSTIPFGDGVCAFDLVNLSNTGLTVRVSVLCTDSNGNSRTVWGEGRLNPSERRTIRCSGKIDLYGKCRMACSLAIEGTGCPTPFFKWDYTAPKMMELKMPSYRSTVSAARREELVRLGIVFNGVQSAVEEVSALLEGPDGKRLCTTNFTVSTLSGAWFSFPLPRTAAIGKYRVFAVADVDGERVSDENFFTVLPVRSGQVIPDQDGTLLADGKSFFPLGLYHVSADEIASAAETGINFIQYWYWNTTSSNALASVELLKRHGLKYVFEGYAWHETVGRQCSERGLTGSPAWRGMLPLNYEMSKEYHRIVTNALAISRESLAMWYSADEASFSQLPEVKRISAYYRRRDVDHPTYTVSTGDPRVGDAADIVGFDFYNRGILRRSNALFGDILDKARAYYGPEKPIFAVPQAFGDAKNHPTETPESIRATAYLVLAHGVNGIIWYSWKESGSRKGIEGAGNNPRTARALKDVIAEIKKLVPALTSGQRRFVRSTDGLVHAAVIGTEEHGRYLIYSNAEELHSSAELHCPLLKGVKLRRISGSAELSAIGDGRFRIEAPPLCAGAFEVTR